MQMKKQPRKTKPLVNLNQIEILSSGYHMSPQLRSLENCKQPSGLELFNQKFFQKIIVFSLIMVLSATTIVVFSSENCRPVTLNVEFLELKFHLHIGKCDVPV
jgi:hypothetical protein